MFFLVEAMEKNPSFVSRPFWSPIFAASPGTCVSDDRECNANTAVLEGHLLRFYDLRRIAFGAFFAAEGRLRGEEGTEQKKRQE